MYLIFLDGFWFCKYHLVAWSNFNLLQTFLGITFPTQPCLVLFSFLFIYKLFDSFESFSHHRRLMVFHWSFRDSKSLQVSRTLLSILADLNNAVVWMVATCTVISKSSTPCIQSFVDITKNNNYRWYNRHFHVPQFFQFPSKVQVLILLFAIFHFYSVVLWDSKVYCFASSLFLLL